MPDSRIQVGIVPDMLGDGISLAVRLKVGDETYRVMRIREGYSEWEEYEPMSSVAVNATMRLSDDIARAMLEALLRHYQGASDMHTVRADLLHERGRVDRLVTAVVDLADKALDASLGN